MLLPVVYEDTVARALREDLAGGDLTSQATVPAGVRARADAVARRAMVVCGTDVFFEVFRQVDRDVFCSGFAKDGDHVGPGEPIWRVEGSARSLLAAERVALNFAQRMTGIATLTQAFVDRVPGGSSTRIADTRKTTPGLRALERHAVRVGGGYNHRDCLGSAVLIKDNHIVAAGGIQAAIARARSHAPHTSRIEIEVDTLAQLEEAIDAKADIIMLDNFSAEDTEAAARRVRGRALLEVSGGVDLDHVSDVAALGVDVISVGALTHSARAADIGLDMDLLP